MTTFPLHCTETAPEGSKELLNGVQKSLGFVPNLMRVMAESPVTLEAYLTLMAQFDKTNFTATEQEVITLSISNVNRCHYCLAAHATVATMKKVSADVIDLARAGGDFTDAKLDALAKLTRSIVETRGWPEQGLLDAFYAEGYTTANYLELLVGVTMKTLSNYVNHQANTPIDEAFGGGK